MEGTGHYLLRNSEYGRPSEGVVTAVSRVTGRDPESLPILYETVDPDVLNGIIEDGVEIVEFEYADFTVTVSEDEIRLSDRPSR